MQKDNFTRIMSWIAILVSLATLIIVLSERYPRANLSFDYMGLIVGIFAILITILIGWQIASMLNIKNEIKDIQNRVNIALAEVIKDAELQSIAVYSTIFEETRQQKEVDIYRYFKYGLLVIIHAAQIDDKGLYSAMIKALSESLPTTRPIRNHEKAELLHLVKQISESPINNEFSELHRKIITEIMSQD